MYIKIKKFNRTLFIIFNRLLNCLKLLIETIFMFYLSSRFQNYLFIYSLILLGSLETFISIIKT
uniref:Uncharacterized protein n=1 Tax=viral metagenome TaxID=1070528 RepID=A0A6C0H7R4_9ZZZZ